MGRRVLSIEIGIQTTRICEIWSGFGTKKVMNSISFPTPSNSVEDGYIIDKGTYSDVLKGKIKEAGFKTNKAIITMSSTKIYTKEVIIPQVSPSKVKDIINTNIADYLPFSTKEYVINYTIVQKVKEGKSKKLRVMLVAVPDNLIKNYFNIAELSGLEVEALDYLGNSIYQVLKEVPEKGTAVYIQMNEQSTLVTILHDHVLVLQRTILYGTDEVLHAVVDRNRSIKDSNEALELLTAEDYIMRDLSAHRDARDEAAASEEVQEDVFETVEAVTETVGYLISSLGRVVDYYINQSGNAIQQMYIFGVGARLLGMKEYIQRELGIFPKSMEQFRGFRVAKNAVEYKKNQTEYANCIGADLSPMRFQPKDIIAKKQKRNNIYSTVFIVAICIGGSILLYMNAMNSYNEAKKEVEDNQLILDSISTGEATQSDIDRVLEQLQQIEELNRLTKRNAEDVYELMGVFEENMVKVADIDSMNVTDESVSMELTLPTKEAATKLIMQLSTLSDYFKSIQISDLVATKDKDTGITSVNFSISCMFITTNEVIDK